MLNPIFRRLVLATVFCGPFAAAEDQPAAFNPQGQPNRNRPGPWDNDVIVQVIGKNGTAEKLENSPPVQGADPGAVKLQDGTWLLVVTGPPREGRQPSGPRSEGPRPQPLMRAPDANGDGVIDGQEIDNAPVALRKLDRNGAGKLTAEELRPAPSEAARVPEPPAPAPGAPAR